METLSNFLKTKAGKARTRQEWASLIGVSQSHFSDIVNGRVPPSLKLAARIRTHTGVSADTYVTDEDATPIDRDPKPACASFATPGGAAMPSTAPVGEGA